MSEIAAKTKWQLTQAAFDKLLATLSSDRDGAGEKYLLLKNSLAHFFEVRGVARSEEATDEVLNRLARKLESGETVENPNTYALGIARMVVFEFRKIPEQTADEEIPEISVLPFDEESLETEEKLKCLEKCLGALPAENREVMIGYYQGEQREKIENRQKLADSLGIPTTTLRNRAMRLRNKLEDCITRCLKEKKP